TSGRLSPTAKQGRLLVGRIKAVDADRARRPASATQALQSTGTFLAVYSAWGVATVGTTLAGTRLVLTVQVAAACAAAAATAIGSAGPAPAWADPAPVPQTPRCIMRGPADCRLPDGHPDLTGLWSLGGPGVGFASGSSEVVFAGRGNTFEGFEADGGLYREAQ